MELVLTVIGLGTLILAAWIAVEFARGIPTVRRLRDVAPAAHRHWPRVSVVVAARNEARQIEAALGSVLAQDYPALEIIAVDDRSTDETGSILARLAAQDTRLVILQVSTLPPGWIGKNHALHVGTIRATGELYLFTDADVVLEPDVLRRAVTALMDSGIDHLTIVPQLSLPTASLRALVSAFVMMFAIYVRPWRVRDPSSGQHLGIGAFNLIRAGAYHDMGGHRVLAMRPDDDMKLGKLVKKHGYRQDVLFGVGMLSVEWYSSVAELIRGLTKNSFADADYQVRKVAGASLMMVMLYIWPFLALIATGGPVLGLNAAVVVVLLWIFYRTGRACGYAGRYGVALPVAALVLLYILWRSTLLALVTGSVEWRGTRYRLADLRANRV